MNFKNRLLLFICMLIGSSLWAQNQTAIIKGKVIDEQNKPIDHVSIQLKNTAIGTRTNENGQFSLTVPAGKNITIVFSSISYENQTIYKKLKEGETTSITIALKPNVINIKTVVKKDDRKRGEAGMVKIDPKLYDKMPSIVGGIEGQLKIFLSNNNELTSQYNVRGGNFDENLVYINDFEVYRPFLVRSGQQEGLSIINPELVSAVSFSTGGFQAKYGDKMSSVLDITYKRPKEFAGSVSLSLLGFGAHIEGVGLNKRFSYMIGLRQKSNQYLLQSQ
ncbi:MAG TPA: TonB-dependent receptor, partial [Chitinophagaceae bacterium]|nr:TonB-dependent receptor [Chitinophagaceae bacterium]